MYRNYIKEALFLKKYRIGEFHKGVVMLTPDSGMLNAIAHGAYKLKSRLRTATEQFTYTKVYIYRDPVKDSYKITDVEVKDSFDFILNSLVKYYHASLWAEIVLKSFGGGRESEYTFELLLDSLRILNNGDERDSVYVSCQFIWRFLTISGLKPELSYCSHCGRFLDVNERVVFVKGSAAIVCSLCAGRGGYTLFQGARAYLEKTQSLLLRYAVKVRLEEQALVSLKKILYQLIQANLEIELNSIKSGVGIL